MKNLVVPVLAICFGIGVLTASPSAADDHEIEIVCDGRGGQDRVTGTITDADVVVELEFICINLNATGTIAVSATAGPGFAVGNFAGVEATTGNSVVITEDIEMMGSFGTKFRNEFVEIVREKLPTMVDEDVVLVRKGDDPFSRLQSIIKARNRLNR